MKVKEIPFARLALSFIVALFVFAAVYRGDLGDAAAITLGSAFIMGLFYLHRDAAHLSYGVPHGAATEVKTAAFLRAQLPSDYIVWTNVLIPNSRSSVGSVEIDVLVVGPNGVFNFEIKSQEGTVYGNEADRQWRLESSRGSGYIRNPVQQAKAQAKALRAYLRENGVLGPVRSAVFMPHATLVTRTKLSVSVFGTIRFLLAFILAAEPGSSPLNVQKAANLLLKGHFSVPPR